MQCLRLAPGRDWEKLEADEVKMKFDNGDSMDVLYKSLDIIVDNVNQKAV